MLPTFKKALGNVSQHSETSVSSRIRKGSSALLCNVKGVLSGDRSSGSSRVDPGTEQFAKEKTRKPGRESNIETEVARNIFVYKAFDCSYEGGRTYGSDIIKFFEFCAKRGTEVTLSRKIALMLP